MDELKENKQQQEGNQSIRAHINDNVNLYTVFAIFNALTIFSTSLNGIEPLKNILTISFLSLSVLVWVAIRFSIQAKKEVSLLIYESLIDIVLLAMIIYWAIQPKEYRNWFTFFFSMILYSHLFGNIFYNFFSRFKWIKNRLDSEKKSMWIVFIFMLIFVMAVITTSLFQKFADYLVVRN